MIKVVYVRNIQSANFRINTYEEVHLVDLFYTKNVCTSNQTHNLAPTSENIPASEHSTADQLQQLTKQQKC